MSELGYSVISEIFNNEYQTTYSFSTRAIFLSLQHIQLLAQNVSFL